MPWWGFVGPHQAVEEMAQDGRSHLEQVGHCHILQGLNDGYSHLIRVFDTLDAGVFFKKNSCSFEGNIILILSGASSVLPSLPPECPPS